MVNLLLEMPFPKSGFIAIAPVIFGRMKLGLRAETIGKAGLFVVLEKNTIQHALPNACSVNQDGHFRGIGWVYRAKALGLCWEKEEGFTSVISLSERMISLACGWVRRHTIVGNDSVITKAERNALRCKADALGEATCQALGTVMQRSLFASTQVSDNAGKDRSCYCS